VLNLGLYISLFPQLIAGHIVSYEDIFKEIASRKVSEEGDLTKLVGLDSIPPYYEVNPFLKLKDTAYSFVRTSVEDFPLETIRTIQTQNTASTKVLFFGDSYSFNFIKFMSLHFKEVLYLRDEFNIEMAEKINPDIVIELSVERFLYKDI
jgi:hypothetical protein